MLHYSRVPIVGALCRRHHSMAQQHAVEPAAYAYLEARPHPWRQQLWLRGRTMTVGQLVATMRSNGLTPEQAAVDLVLPLAQIAEALFYYAEHHALVDRELREDRKRLQTQGYTVEPPAVS